MKNTVNIPTYVKNPAQIFDYLGVSNVVLENEILLVITLYYVYLLMYFGHVVVNNVSKLVITTSTSSTNDN